MQTFLDLFFRTSIDWKNQPPKILVMSGRRRGERNHWKSYPFCAIDATTVEVTFSDGTVEEFTVAEMSDGENTVTFTYNEQEFTETVTYNAPDTNAPVLTLDQSEETVASAEYTVSGSVDEESTVTVNGTEVTVADDMTFSTTVTLEEGANTVTVVAEDAAGNTSEESLTVTLDSTAPALTLDQSEETVASAEYTVSGSVDEESTVTVNGTEVTVADDMTFSTTVTLEEEENTITVVAEDELGNSSEKSLVVTLDTTAPVIDSAEVSDYQTLVVNFSEEVQGTPEVTVNGTDMSDSVTLDGSTLEIVKEAGFDAGDHEVVVNGLSDLVENAMAADASVTITKEASVVADFSSITFTDDSPLQAAYTGDFTVNFKIYDQYGRDITGNIAPMTLTVEGNIDGMSVPVDDSNANDGEVLVDAEDLIDGKLLTLVFTAKDGEGNVLATTSFKYNFDTESAPEATTIKEIAVDSSEMQIEAAKTLTAKVFDQYGSEFTNAGVDYLRWQITEGSDVIEFDSAPAETTVDADSTVDITATDVGTAEVTVFIVESGVEVEQRLTLTVTPKALAGLNVDTAVQPANTYNQEEFTAFEVLPVDADGGNAAVLDINKMSVEAVDAATEDINVSLVENEDGIFAKVTTYTPGTYDIKVTHENSDGDPFEVTGTVTTTLNPNVDSITLEDMEVNELTEGGTVYKEVSFFNKHGEEIEVNDTAISVSVSDNLTLDGLYTADEDGKVDTLTTNPVKFVGIIANGSTADQTADVTVATNGKTASISFEIASAAEVTDVNLSSLVSEFDEWAVSDSVAYMPIEFIDQYENSMALKYDDVPASAVKIYNSDNVDKTADFAIDWGKVADDTKEGYAKYSAASSGDEIAAIELGFAGAVADTYTLKVLDAEENVLVEQEFVVKEERVASSFTLSSSALTMTTNGQKDVTLTVVDQYGVPVSAAAGSVTSADTNVVTVTAGNPINTDAEGKDTITLKAQSSGAADVTVSVTGIEAEKVISVEVGTYAMIDSVEIVPVSEDIALSDLFYADDATTVAYDVDFTVKAYDADMNELDIGDSDIYTFDVTSVKDVDGVETGTISTANVDTSTLTVNFANVANTLPTSTTGTVEIKVEAQNGVSDTVVLDFSQEDPVASTGSVWFYTGDLTDEYTKVEDSISLVDATDIKATGTVNYANVKASDINMVTDGYTDKIDVLAITPGTNLVTVDPLETGAANLYIRYEDASGVNTKEIAVPVEGPKEVSATALAGAEAEVTWTPAVSAGITSQRLEVNVNSGGWATETTFADNTTNSYTYTTGADTDTVEFRVVGLTDATPANEINSASSSAITLDGSVPTFPTVTMASDNADTTLAKVGDTVTLTIVASEDIQSPTVTVDGNTATISDSGDSDATTWKATYTMQSGDTEGPLAFTLNADDLLGNSAAEVTAVTGGSTVTFDETAPTVNTAGTAGTIDNASSMDIVFSEELSNKTAIENAVDAAVTANNDATYTLSWTTTNVANDTLTITEDSSTGVGTDTLDVSAVTNDIIDLAGNTTADANIIQ